MKKWKKTRRQAAIVLAVLMAAALAFPVLGETKEAPSVIAQSAVLMDGETGRVLYGKAENEIRPMASTTKIMTTPSWRWKTPALRKRCRCRTMRPPCPMCS